MDIKIYCSLDESGNIISAMAGENIKAPDLYDFTTTVSTWEFIESLHLYKVVNGALVPKEV